MVLLWGHCTHSYNPTLKYHNYCLILPKWHVLNHNHLPSTSPIMMDLHEHFPFLIIDECWHWWWQHIVIQAPNILLHNYSLVNELKPYFGAYVIWIFYLSDLLKTMWQMWCIDCHNGSTPNLRGWPVPMEIWEWVQSLCFLCSCDGFTVWVRILSCTSNTTKDIQISTIVLSYQYCQIFCPT